MIQATKMAAINKRFSDGLVRLIFGVSVCMPFPLMTRSGCGPRVSGRRLRLRCWRTSSGDVAELCGFIDELNGDGRGGLRALATVFNDHGINDLRVVCRREADEPGIGQPLGFVMLLAILFDIIENPVALIIINRD